MYTWHEHTCTRALTYERRVRSRRGHRRLGWINVSRHRGERVPASKQDHHGTGTTIRSQVATASIFSRENIEYLISRQSFARFLSHNNLRWLKNCTNLWLRILMIRKLSSIRFKQAFAFDLFEHRERELVRGTSLQRARKDARGRAGDTRRDTTATMLLFRVDIPASATVTRAPHACDFRHES